MYQNQALLTCRTDLWPESDILRRRIPCLVQDELVKQLTLSLSLLVGRLVGIVGPYLAGWLLLAQFLAGGRGVGSRDL